MIDCRAGEARKSVSLTTSLLLLLLVIVIVMVVDTMTMTMLMMMMSGYEMTGREEGEWVWIIMNKENSPLVKYMTQNTHSHYTPFKEREREESPHV